LQQWLRERASKLRYMYIVFLLYASLFSVTERPYNTRK